MALSGAQHHAIYTQFCIGVELGDETLVRELVMRGADTMVSYGVDGVITTPMRTALKKGDMPMVLALLTSRSTKVKLADLDAAPKIKRELVTPMLMDRLTRSLEDGAKETLIKRPSGGARRGGIKVSLSDSLSEHVRKLQEADASAHKEAEEADSDSVSTTSVSSSSSLLKASPTDRPRCPPKQLEDQSDEEEDEEDVLSSAPPSDEEEEAPAGSSIASSAGDSSDLEDE